MELDFEFYAGGIEDGILELLTTKMRPAPLGVKQFETYSGQLDTANFEKALASKATIYPLVMVSYADGEDTRMPATSAVLGRSQIYRHDCTFAVICADNNPQGERSRRRSKVYAMIAAVRETLAGRRLKKLVDDEEVLLTFDVLEPVANEYIARLPNITAYAVIFRTWFKWRSPDRTGEAVDVTDVIVGVDSLNEATVQDPTNLPGVTIGENDV